MGMFFYWLVEKVNFWSFRYFGLFFFFLIIKNVDVVGFFVVELM